MGNLLLSPEANKKRLKKKNFIIIIIEQLDIVGPPLDTVIYVIPEVQVVFELLNR